MKGYTLIIYESREHLAGKFYSKRAVNGLKAPLFKGISSGKSGGGDRQSIKLKSVWTFTYTNVP